MKKRTIDMTYGSIIKCLVSFSIPLLMSSVIQQMYNTVDLLYVGNVLGGTSAAAVGAGAMLITCLIGIFSGMSVGTNIVLAKFFGSSDKEDLKKGIHTSVFLALINGVILTGIGIIGAPYILKIMNTPMDIIKEAVIYIRIYFLSITSMLMYNICSGIIRAGGNSRTPMTAQFMGGIINIIANYLFICVFDWGIKGAAAATFFSQTAGALIVFKHLLLSKDEFKFEFKNLKLNKDIMKQIIYIGVPAGIQSMVISLSNAVVQSYINGLDVYSISAFVYYMKVELIIYYPIMAIGQSAMTFVGQNIGACKIERMKKGIYMCVFLGIIITCVLSIILLNSGAFWFQLFDKDKNIIDSGLKIIKITFPFYFIYVIMEVLSSSVRGMGKSIPPMIIVLSNICIFRIILLYIIGHNNLTIKNVASVYPITWISTAVFISIYYFMTIRKIYK